MAEEKKTTNSQEEKSPLQLLSKDVKEQKSPLQLLMDSVCEIPKDAKGVNLFGPQGVGKTRMAKRLCKRAIMKKIFDFTLWVFMCKKYTKKSLSESIARQLCLVRTTYEGEVEGDNNVEKDYADDYEELLENTETLIGKLKEVFNGLRSDPKKANREPKYAKILLILDDVDDEPKKENEENFWSLWNEVFPSDLNLEIYKVLISRLNRNDKDIYAYEVKPLPSIYHSYSLLIEHLVSRLKRSETIQTLGKKFIEKSSKNLLASRVIMLAKALNYFGLDKSGVSILQKELEEASENYSVSKLLCMKHDVLPIGVLKDLCWRGHHFFRNSGSVHFSELITYWILEGYLGFGLVKKLYNKGHGILMELMDCGIVKAQEGGYVILEKSLIDPDHLYQFQFLDQTPSLGLATLFTSDEEGFGRITHGDGMLKTPPTLKKKSSKESSEEGGQNLSTLFLDSTHSITDQVMPPFLESETKLQVLALFNPTIRYLPKALEKMDKLRVLVLRGCVFLQNVKVELPLGNLQVLEISGTRSLRTLSSVFFKNMSNLKSVHLSGLQIATLPQAIYNLVNLQWLIVKDCPRLKSLDNISKLTKLLVVDLSGNTSLDDVDKNFLNFKKLQSLNLSGTEISTTPLLKNIGELTHLFCRDCKSLDRLRGLTGLTGLQTLDLSGSERFEEFHDSTLESLTSLRTFNLSGTILDRLPSSIANPHYLYFKNCPRLQQLSCIGKLENLKELDLSGSKNLKTIDPKFFDHMVRLQLLNLSETKVDNLPSLSNLSDLRQLLISHCRFLRKLPSLQSSTKLEILDASHCIALDDIEDGQSFKTMTCLRKLDFSETRIKSLPSLATEKNNLCQLSLKNCTALQNLELKGPFLNLEELNLSGITSLKPNGAEFVKDETNLRILDLSFTSLEQLPSMSELINLTHLSLAGWLFKETELDLPPLNKIQVLDLSGSSINRLPNLINSKHLQKLLLKDCLKVEGFTGVNLLEKIPDEISELRHLDYLEFPDIKIPEEEVNQDHWKICMLSDTHKPPVFLSGTQVVKKKYLPSGPYHLYAIPAENGDTYLQRHELVFRDVYLQTCGFAAYNEHKSLQIHGFNKLPKGIENIISEVNLVFLIDYKLIELPSEIDASMLKELKGFWIERCHELIDIFHKPGFEINLENLGIGNNHGLKSIRYNGFGSLKSLYIDGCPSLTTVFPSSSMLPKSLEVIQIKYCDKIMSLFETQGELGNLTTLHLHELPQLQKIELACFSRLQTLKILECPKLKQTEETFEIPRGLKTLWISGATSLKSLHTENKSIHLEHLKLENCQMLEYVLSSSSPLAKIRTIDIRSCEKMHTLFSDIDQTIIASLTSSIEMFSIEECPNFNRNQ